MIAITILGELRRVAYRPISIWPFITKVVKIWQKLPKSKQPILFNCKAAINLKKSDLNEANNLVNVKA